jgi:hypothetical protein
LSACVYVISVHCSILFRKIILQWAWREHWPQVRYFRFCIKGKELWLLKWVTWLTLTNHLHSFSGCFRQYSEIGETLCQNTLFTYLNVTLLPFFDFSQLENNLEMSNKSNLRLNSFYFWEKKMSKVFKNKMYPVRVIACCTEVSIN